MRQSPKYPVVQARLVILLSILLTAINFAPSIPEGEHNVEYLLGESEQRYQQHLAQRETECWQMIVETVAKETRIKDMVLAERVARAIEEASAEFDMDPWLIASLIRVESAGNPDAVSKVGALGLTQIMSATGFEIAQDLEIADYSTDMLYHPETNVRMGTYYLRKLLDRFDGDLHIALAAYNWGPSRIAQRIALRQALPVEYPGKILKRIPEQPKWVEIAARG